MLFFFPFVAFKEIQRNWSHPGSWALSTTGTVPSVPIIGLFDRAYSVSRRVWHSEASALAMSAVGGG